MNFDAFLNQEQSKPRKGRRLTFALSLAVHGAVLCGAVAFSFAHVDELSPPTTPVILFKQPVPPPPPAGAPRQTAPKVRHRPTEIVQPDRTRVLQPPEKPQPENPTDGPGDPNITGPGVPGGQGIGPPPPVQTTFIAPKVATGRLAINPQDPDYQARLPLALARAGMRYWALLKVCVRLDGQVGEVKILQGADPTLDPNIVAAVRTWRYHPYTVDGRPVPFCTNVRYEISASR